MLLHLKSFTIVRNSSIHVYVLVLWLLKYDVHQTIHTGCFVFPYFLHCCNCLLDSYGIRMYNLPFSHAFVHLELFSNPIPIHFINFIWVPYLSYIFPAQISFLGFFSVIYLRHWVTAQVQHAMITFVVTKCLKTLVPVSWVE